MCGIRRRCAYYFPDSRLGNRLLRQFFIFALLEHRSFTGNACIAPTGHVNIAGGWQGGNDERISWPTAQNFRRSLIINHKLASRHGRAAKSSLGSQANGASTEWLQIDRDGSLISQDRAHDLIKMQQLDFIGTRRC